MAVKDKIDLLRQMYGVIGEAVQALQQNENMKKRIDALEKIRKEQEEKIRTLEIIRRGLETISEKKVQICSECLGAGAYIINGETEECNQCDGQGWIEKT